MMVDLSLRQRQFQIRWQCLVARLSKGRAKVDSVSFYRLRRLVHFSAFAGPPAS